MVVDHSPDAVALELQPLRDNMKNRDMTNRWDVVVAYDQDCVNALLKTDHDTKIAKFKAANNASPLENIKIEAPVLGSTTQETVNFVMTVGSPTLKVDGSDCSLSLQFPLSGSSSGPGPSDKETFGNEGDMFFRCSNKLISIVCGLGDDPVTKNTDPNASPVVNLSPDNQQQIAVVLDLGLCRDSKIFRITKEGKEQEPAFYELAAQRLQNYLLTSRIKYHLGGVSNKVDGAPSTLTLKPTKFVMTGIKVPGHSAIVFWMNVAGSGSVGLENSDNFDLCFTKSGSKDRISPIMLKGQQEQGQDYTACVMLSNYILTELLIRSSLSSKGYTDIEWSDSLRSDVYGGIGFYARAPSHTINVPDMDNGGSWEKEMSHKFSFNMNSAKASFHLNDSYNGGEVKYTAKTMVQRIEYPSPTFGNVQVDFTTGCSGSWESNANRIHLGMQWRSPFAVECKPIEGKLDWFVMKNNSATDQLRNLQVPIPNVELDLGSINYFLSTNLLFPGKFRFVPATKIFGTGIMLPHDMLLTGFIQKS